MTRQAVLEHAMRLASRVGLEGVTIGALAAELGLSKSGLFAHFRSKETLQIQLLEFGATHFIGRVILPALRERRGTDRIVAIFERWMKWTRSEAMPGGCIFAAASFELDARPGSVRDRLVELQRDWLAALERSARIAVEEGEFHAGVDAEQFAHELYGIMLTYHHARRLLRDPKAEQRARRSFESLVDRSRTAVCATVKSAAAKGGRR